MKVNIQTIHLLKEVREKIDDILENMPNPSKDEDETAIFINDQKEYMKKLDKLSNSLIILATKIFRRNI